MPKDGRGAHSEIRGRDLLNGVPKDSNYTSASN